MVKLPLAQKLKKKLHKEIALAQDILIIEIYHYFSNSVIHGGTAIWRCYGSQRFSEDIDIYLSPKAAGRLNNFASQLKQKNFEVKKFRKTNNSVFATLNYGAVVVRFEALLKEIKNYQTAPFELADGTTIIVNTLSPADLIKEKVTTYLKRRRIRDLYDIFYLLQLLEASSFALIKPALRQLLEKFSRPIDEQELKPLIITGAVPKTEDMLRAIEKCQR